jgi:SAM-dependent methyltransferase
VKQSLDLLRQSREGEFLWQIHLLKQEVGELKSHLRRYGLQEANKYETELKALRDELESDRWPAAVDQQMICRDELQFRERAEGILNIVVGEDLKDRTFLDYGCGEGHVTVMAKERGATVVGYDLEPKWKSDLAIFTTDFETVRKQGPYEIILLHDVLDHIQSIDPVTALQQVRALMGRETRVYIRNHPWCARHGGHVYEDVNKAFVHLVFDDVELTRLTGVQSAYNIKVSRPLDTYRHWFKMAELEVKSEIPIRRDVEKFFLEPTYAHQRLKQKWEDSAQMIQDLEIEFVEYLVQSPQMAPEALL